MPLALQYAHQDDNKSMSKIIIISFLAIVCFSLTSVTKSVLQLATITAAQTKLYHFV